MKKRLALFFAGLMACSLVGCGGNDGNEGATAEEATSIVAEENVDEFQKLIDAAKEEGTLVVYGSCEEEYLSAVCAKFQEVTGIQTSYQRLSTGEVLTKIGEENGTPGYAELGRLYAIGYLRGLAEASDIDLV